MFNYFVVFVLVFLKPLISFPQCGYRLLVPQWDSDNLQEGSHSLKFADRFLLRPISNSKSSVDLRFIKNASENTELIIRIFCDSERGWRTEKYLLTTAISKEFYTNYIKRHENSISNSLWERDFMLNDSNWVLIKHDFISPVSNDDFWNNVWQKLIENKIFSLPSDWILHDRRFLNTIEKYGHIDSIPFEDESSIIYIGGATYRIELKFEDEYRFMNFSNPDQYAKLHPEIPEFKQYLALIEVFKVNFGILN